MIYTEKQIKKIFKIKELRKIKQEVLSLKNDNASSFKSNNSLDFKNDDSLTSKIKYTIQEKQNLLLCIDERIKTIQNYYEKTNKEQKTKLTRYTISYNQEQNQALEIDLKRLQDYAKNNKLKMKDLIKLKSLSKDTLKPQELDTQQQNQEQEIHKKELIKEAIQIFRNLGTNINQITRDINERRLVGGFLDNNLTKTERDKILSTVQQIENEFLKFIENNL